MVPLTVEQARQLAPGVRVRWNSRRTYFGRVIGPCDVWPLLDVQQEDGGPRWALNANTDFIFTVSEVR